MNKKPLNSIIPYFAVIFTSVRNDNDEPGYQKMASNMENLARQQSGFLGFDSCRESFGVGITVSYWQTLEAIHQWKANLAHIEAQNKGKEKWYDYYSVRICSVEKEYTFEVQESV